MKSVSVEREELQKALDLMEFRELSRVLQNNQEAMNSLGSFLKNTDARKGGAV